MSKSLNLPQYSLYSIDITSSQPYQQRTSTRGTCIQYTYFSQNHCSIQSPVSRIKSILRLCTCTAIHPTSILSLNFKNFHPIFLKKINLKAQKLQSLTFYYFKMDFLFSFYYNNVFKSTFLRRFELGKHIKFQESFTIFKSLLFNSGSF